MARESCCAVIHLKEDNARFILLILFLVTYILVGATIFSAVERTEEINEREKYNQTLTDFIERYITNKSDLTHEALMDMLRNFSYAQTKGITEEHRPRWDFPGAFYFVATVVSTIGFGMTSPSTNLGRALLICYGLPGCAACILFFNVFLERLITFLAYVMKQCHERKVRKEKVKNGIPTAAQDGRRPSQQSDDNLDNWKPSVYWVLLYLIVAVTIITCCASAVYEEVETDWNYFDSVYFCFVAFSTIGFGDYVSSQKQDYLATNKFLYRFANFIFLVSGVCCIYSLYNVLSIVIKQFLNLCLKKLDCRCCHRRKPRPRRNAITPGQLRTGANNPSKRNDNGAQPATVDVCDVDSNYDSETDGRRMSGEMISMKDFLAANKVSLAVMQKQLYETSNKTRGAPGLGGHGHSHHTSNGAFGGGIGGIAMLNNKLAETERRE